MPLFEYRALNEKGIASNGVMDADTPKAARDKLRAQRLFATDVRALDDAQTKAGKSILPAVVSGKRLNDVSNVTRQLAVLLNAGIPLAQAMQAIVEQAQNVKLQTVFRDVREQIVQGLPFADALSRHPGYFSDLYVNMVKAGEASGTVDQVLTRLADYIQSQTKLRNRISAALAYPTIMIIIGCLVVVFLMVAVVPKITELLEAQERALPAITEILIAVSSLLRGYWWAFLIGLIGAYAGWYMWSNSDSGKLQWHTMLLKIPVLGELMRRVAISRFAVTFSALLKSGIPALEALKITQSVVENKVLASVLKDVHGAILEGSDIATPIKKSKMFPPVVGYMMAIGEQSGRLEELLDRIAEAYDEEVELATQKFTSMLEPILIVLMALVVGFIVAAIMIPLLQLSQGVAG